MQADASLGQKLSLMDDDHMAGRIASVDDGSRPDDRVIAQLDSRQNHRVGADPAMAADPDGPAWGPFVEIPDPMIGADHGHAGSENSPVSNQDSVDRLNIAVAAGQETVVDLLAQRDFCGPMDSARKMHGETALAVDSKNPLENEIDESLPSEILR